MRSHNHPTNIPQSIRLKLSNVNGWAINLLRGMRRMRSRLGLPRGGAGPVTRRVTRRPFDSTLSVPLCQPMHAPAHPPRPYDARASVMHHLDDHSRSSFPRACVCTVHDFFGWGVGVPTPLPPAALPPPPVASPPLCPRRKRQGAARRSALRRRLLPAGTLGRRASGARHLRRPVRTNLRHGPRPHAVAPRVGRRGRGGSLLQRRLDVQCRRAGPSLGARWRPQGRPPPHQRVDTGGRWGARRPRGGDQRRRRAPDRPGAGRDGVT